MLATTLSVTMPRTWRAEHLYLLGLYPNAKLAESPQHRIRHTSIGPSARSLLMLYSPRPPSRLPHSPCHEFLDSRSVSRHNSFTALSVRILGNPRSPWRNRRLSSQPATRSALAKSKRALPWLQRSKTSNTLLLRKGRAEVYQRAPEHCRSKCLRLQTSRHMSCEAFASFICLFRTRGVTGKGARKMLIDPTCDRLLSSDRRNTYDPEFHPAGKLGQYVAFTCSRLFPN